MWLHATFYHQFIAGITYFTVGFIEGQTLRQTPIGYYCIMKYNPTETRGGGNVSETGNVREKKSHSYQEMCIK